MTDLEIHIRPARLENLDAIARLWIAMMQDHRRADPRVRLADGAAAAYSAYVNYHLTERDSCVRVVEVEGRVVAFGLLTIARNLQMFDPPRFGYLSDLVVDAAWRRRGIGRRLVAHLLEWLRRRKIDCLQLQHYENNKAGEAFWRACGFEPYYTRMWLDVE